MRTGRLNEILSAFSPGQEVLLVMPGGIFTIDDVVVGYSTGNVYILGRADYKGE